jgi:4-hydroxy-tetrahydrodipicolinate synthase
MAGDDVEAARLQASISALGKGIYSVGEADSSYLRGLKCALSLMGICSGTLAEPYESFTPVESERVRQALVKLGLLREISSAP